MPELTRRSLFAALAASPAAMELITSTMAKAADLAASGLVGELQGPTMITDPAQWPKKFSEAPMLAELVKAGQTAAGRAAPSGRAAWCWKPLNEIGSYGGTWRRGFIGPGDGENGNRINSSDKLLLWSADGSKIVPCVAKG